jgi:N5-(cytidine 5'-diphosphoramidyl)-L-glutamine hydrolase
MLAVGVTQRVEVSEHGERRDALDQAWAPLLLDAGFAPVPLPNRGEGAAALIERFGLAALLLTGGNDLGTAPERDALEGALLDEARERRLPVLAVCRGLQMVNAHLGGELARVDGHVAAPHAVLTARDERYAEVNSFHDWGIGATGLAPELEPLLRAPDGSMEAATHRELPWTGVMWHPERDCPDAALQHEIVARALRGEPFPRR